MITREALQSIEGHWAVAAVPRNVRSRAKDVARYRHLQASIGQQLALSFSERKSDDETLRRVALAYELAAAEGIRAFLHPSADTAASELANQARAGAHRAYELFRALSIPEEEESRIFHVLHTSALAYCGQRWPDVRRWLRESREATAVPSVANSPWDERVLYRLFDCWIRLFRKQGWNDLDDVRSIVAGLREDQKGHEPPVLKPSDDPASKAMACRLIALYHWAKATELLALYVLNGQPTSATTELDKHFEAARAAGTAASDPPFETLLRWLHVAARMMVVGSIWWVAQTINSKTTEFIRHVTHSRSLFEFLPPQRAALQEQGLLDQASRAVVVDLPTSGGKTILAQFRMLQAINQFQADSGWVAYVAPTRALTAQVARRLRSDFRPLGINVELLTAAVEVDSFEEDLLEDSSTESPLFHVLVSTPEKLDLIIRNKKVSRPLALVVMDEAHNLEDDERGLRIELLLATIKRDCPSASFMLMMPHVPNANELTTWLDPDSGKTISLGTSAWQPNERVVGVFEATSEDEPRGSWQLQFESMTTTPRTVHLSGRHTAGPARPLDMAFSKAKGVNYTTGAMAKVFSGRGTSIAVVDRTDRAWLVAKEVSASLDPLEPVPREVALVQRFLATEVGPQFELIEMLRRGVAVHHAGLSDEARALVEWLTECDLIRVLCSTTTIAQGINFPVSSVFLATTAHPYGHRMSSRSFWNLAGRAGRIDHDSVGIVGIAAGRDREQTREFIISETGNLVSRLVYLLDQLEGAGELQNLNQYIYMDQWRDFRRYVAHLWNETQDLDEMLANTEQLLRNTFGYQSLRGRPVEREKAETLLEATKHYARQVADNPGSASLADSTGFAPEGVQKALTELGGLEKNLTPSDWEPDSLFRSRTAQSALPRLIGVMMQIPEIKSTLEEIASRGLSNQHIAKMAHAWVTGKAIDQIAKTFFMGTKDRPVSETMAITHACRAIYRNLASAGTWGISALSKLPPSGLDFDALSPDDQRRINALPAMLYHGVHTEEGVLMRMNAVPRSIAVSLGERFKADLQDSQRRTAGVARDFLKSLTDGEWDQARPRRAQMSGADYRAVWNQLSGEHHQ